MQSNSWQQSVKREYLFLSFAAALGGRQITSSGILYQVSVIMVKYRSRDPRKANPCQHALDKLFRDMYKGYKDEDAAP